MRRAQQSGYSRRLIWAVIGHRRSHRAETKTFFIQLPRSSHSRSLLSWWQLIRIMCAVVRVKSRKSHYQMWVMGLLLQPQPRNDDRSLSILKVDQRLSSQTFQAHRRPSNTCYFQKRIVRKCVGFSNRKSVRLLFSHSLKTSKSWRSSMWGEAHPQQQQIVFSRRRRRSLNKARPAAPITLEPTQNHLWKLNRKRRQIYPS